jgi:sec-independent protein translocase protein TatA
VVVLSGISGWHVWLGGFMFEGLFQPMHLLVIFAIALLVFGPKKLPELGKGLGEGIRALKNGMKDNDTKAEIKPDTKPVITSENNPENKA